MQRGSSCWLCGRNGAQDPLDRHHIFGGPNRAKSERYGLTVYLCHGSCHLYGPTAAHNCRETMDMLHRYGQRLAMERQGWATDEFAREFGRSYLTDEDVTEPPAQEPGSFELVAGDDLPW